MTREIPVLKDVAAGLDRDQARQMAASVAWIRVGIGAVGMVAPTLVARPWIGADASRKTVKVFARAMAVRDLALGLGVIIAMRHDAPVRGWVEGGGLADTGDVIATLLAFGSLPRLSRWLVVASASGGAAAAQVLAPVVDAGP
jgi:hypothetical protein